MHDPELDRFKRDVHLVQFAIERHGYLRDRQKSSRLSHVLGHPTTGDKIIVRRESDGHWTYFSLRDDRDNGTIIDFVLGRLRRASLGEVREELRRWLGTARPEPPCRPSTAPCAPARDPKAVAAAFAEARVVRDSPYLRERGLRRDIVAHRRFAGTWRQDRRGNVLFAHKADAGELTGFEVKNRGFTQFSPGGTKAAWQSNAEPSDRFVTITESAIDGLSYHALHPERGACSRYWSTAGAPGRGQLAILGSLLGQLPAGLTVVGATDADDAGRKLAARIEELVRALAHLGFERHEPVGAKDWNELLQRQRSR